MIRNETLRKRSSGTANQQPIVQQYMGRVVGDRAHGGLGVRAGAVTWSVTRSLSACRREGKIILKLTGGSGDLSLSVFIDVFACPGTPRPRDFEGGEHTAGRRRALRISSGAFRHSQFACANARQPEGCDVYPSLDGGFFSAQTGCSPPHKLTIYRAGTIKNVFGSIQWKSRREPSASHEKLINGFYKAEWVSDTFQEMNIEVMR